MKISYQEQDHHCKHCDKDLSKPMLAAYGQHEPTVVCDGCASRYSLVREGDGEGIQLKLRDTHEYRLRVVAVLAPPYKKGEPRKAAWTFAEFDVAIDKPITKGLSPFNDIVEYNNIKNAVADLLPLSPHSCVYGVGTLPQVCCVLPRETYISLGARQLIKFFGVYDDMLSKIGELLVTMSKIKDVSQKNKDVRISHAVCAHLMAGSMWLGDYANTIISQLPISYEVVFKDGVFYGVRRKDTTFQLKKIVLDLPIDHLIANVISDPSRVVDMIRGKLKGNPA